jgi:hypothetical protein
MYVKKQTEMLVPLMKGRTTLFIGVPTYEENRPGHRPWAENIRTSIIGMQLALNDLGIRENRDIGIAIFAEWTTDENEWATLRDEWFGD